jgi:hypothetical protein
VSGLHQIKKPSTSGESGASTSVGQNINPNQTIGDRCGLAADASPAGWDEHRSVDAPAAYNPELFCLPLHARRCKRIIIVFGLLRNRLQAQVDCLAGAGETSRQITGPRSIR